jgi:hypothetical protein
VTTASVASIGSSEASRSRQLRVGFDVLAGHREVTPWWIAAREHKCVLGRDNEMASLQDFYTGATGLEPATSGVTGHFYGHDG